MRLKSFRLLAIVLLVVTASLFFSGCSSSEETRDMALVSEQAPMGNANDSTANYGEATPEEQKASSPTTASVEQYDQMIIYNGSLYIEVDDINEAAKQINAAILNTNGYLINSYKNENDYHINAYYEYKIPVDQFHNVFSQIENMPIGKITSQNTGSTNVTEEYYDIEARLNAKRAYEARLLEFLAKAEKTEDLLKISNDLNRVQEEIESLVGRQKYLEHHTNNSTLVVELVQYKDKVAPTASTFEKAIQGFKDSVKFIVDLFEGIFVLLITFIPILVVLIIIILLVMIFRKSYRKRLKSKKDNTNDKEDQVEEIEEAEHNEIDQ